MSSNSSMWSRPFASSSTIPLSVVGRASGARSVLKTTNSCVDGPWLLMLNVTEPALAVDVSSVMAKSFSVAPTPPAAVVGALPADDPDELFDVSLLLEHAAPNNRSRNAGTATYLRRTRFMRQTPFGRRTHPGPASF